MKQLYLPLALSLVCLLPLGCQTASSKPTTGTTGPEAVSTLGGQTKLGLTGTLMGFTGESPRFKVTDAPKVSIEEDDDTFARVTGTVVVHPDSQGYFVIPDSQEGSYFAVATLPDGSLNAALLTTDSPTDNFISPGTTLAYSWMLNQLSSKLVFVGDLPTSKFLLIGTALDADLTAGKLTLAATDSARLQQLATLTTTDTTVGGELTAIEADLKTRAADNLLKEPAYVTNALYTAKIKQLGLKAP